MRTLQDEIKKDLTDMGGEVAAWIVDDEVTKMDLVDEPDWLIFLNALQPQVEAYDELIVALRAQGYTSGVPTLTELTEAAKAFALPESARPALDRCLKPSHILAQLSSLLGELGFQVTRYASDAEARSRPVPFLLFLDYQMKPEVEPGSRAQELLRGFMNTSHESGRVPPFVVLMSQNIDQNDMKTWTQFVEKAGFFRFHFDFLQKESFRRKPSDLCFSVLSFLRYRQVSEAYFQQVQAIQGEISKISTTVAQDLLQVTPSEARMYESRMHYEGLPLSKALSNLFAESVTAKLSTSVAIAGSMSNLEAAVSREGLPAVEIPEFGRLHALCSELLHRPASSDGPPEFGDIYVNGSGRFFLILTQECDTATGEDRNANSDRLLAVEGELRDDEAPRDSRAIICKPFVEERTSDGLKQERRNKWCWWHLDRPTILKVEKPVVSASAPSGGSATLPELVRRYTLRFLDADQIQLAFAAHLMRVGTSVHPSPVTKAQVHMEGAEAEESVEVYTMEQVVENGKKRKFAAVCPGSRSRCLELGVSANLILRLSQFTELTQFKNELQRERFHLSEVAGGPWKLKRKQPSGSVAHVVGGAVKPGK